MKYLIVEDERFAYEELKRMMTELRPGGRRAKCYCSYGPLRQLGDTEFYAL